MAATVFNQAQLELLDMMQWVKSPEALAILLRLSEFCPSIHATLRTVKFLI